MRRFRGLALVQLLALLALIGVGLPRCHGSVDDDDGGFWPWISWLLEWDGAPTPEFGSYECATAGVAAALPNYAKEQTSVTLQELARMAQYASQHNLRAAASIAASRLAKAVARGKDDAVARMMAAKLSLRGIMYKRPGPPPGLSPGGPGPVLADRELQQAKEAIRDLELAGAKLHSPLIAASAYVTAASAAEQLQIALSPEGLKTAVGHLIQADRLLTRAEKEATTQPGDREPAIIVTGVLWGETANVWTKLGPAALAPTAAGREYMPRARDRADSLLMGIATGTSPLAPAALPGLRKLFEQQKASSKRGWLPEPTKTESYWQAKLDGLETLQASMSQRRLTNGASSRADGPR